MPAAFLNQVVLGNVFHVFYVHTQIVGMAPNGNYAVRVFISDPEGKLKDKITGAQASFTYGDLLAAKTKEISVDVILNHEPTHGESFTDDDGLKEGQLQRTAQAINKALTRARIL